MTNGKSLLGNLAKKIDDQEDPKQVYLDNIERKKERMEEGGVPEEKRPL